MPTLQQGPAAEASGSAVFSPCGRYRYLLTRQWSGGRGTCLFVMLNPSSADAAIDDPTIRKCAAFVRRWGFQGLEVVNLFAGRAATPEALFRMPDPCGQENDAHIEAGVDRADHIVAAWGNCGATGGRDRVVMPVLRQSGKEVSCLAVNLTGAPRHPLYVPGNQARKWFA